LQHTLRHQSLQAIPNLERQGYLQVGRLPQQAAYNFALLDPRLNFGVANLLKGIDITLVVFLNLFEGIEWVKLLGHPIFSFFYYHKRVAKPRNMAELDANLVA
jgi:hypothetical protein